MALREVLVAFGVQFDAKTLANANAQIDGTIGKLKDMGAALAGAFALGKIKDFVFGLADQADALRDQSRMLGMNIKDLQAWQHAAGQNGVAAEEFNGALTKFQRNTAEAAKGTGAAASVFGELGVKVKDSSGHFVDSGTLLEGVAAGLEKVKDPAKRTAVAMDLFGRSGAKLLPLFAEGPAGIRKLREEFDELGGGITQEFADQADELNDNLDKLGKAALATKVRIAGFLVPAINTAVQWLTRTGIAFRKATEGTNLLQAAMITLGAAGAASAVTILSKWAPVLKAFARQAALIGLGILLVEDLIGTFEGKDSVIRRIVDGWFGEGSTQKVVNFFKEIGDGFGKVLVDATMFSDEYRQTWEATLDDIRDDFGDTFLGRIGGEIMSAFADLFFASMNAIAGDWSDKFQFLKALGEGLFFSFEVVFEDIRHVAGSAAAYVQDAFAVAWNAINEGGIAAAGAIEKLLGFVPGLKDLGKSIGDSVRGAFSVSLDTDNVDQEKGRNQLAQGRLFAKAERLDEIFRGQNSVARTLSASEAQGASGAFADISAPITINQNFPPGSPAQQARQAATGAGEAARKGINRGAAAAFERRGK